MMYVAVFAISVLIGCGAGVFILALFNADSPTREDYDALKLESESWHRLAVKYHTEMLQAQQLQEVWKFSAMKRGETDAEEPPESKE